MAAVVVVIYKPKLLYIPWFASADVTEECYRVLDNYNAVPVTKPTASEHLNGPQCRSRSR